MNFKRNLLASSVAVASAAILPVVANAVTIDTFHPAVDPTVSFTLTTGDDFTVTNTGAVILSGLSFPPDVLSVQSGIVNANVTIDQGGLIIATPTSGSAAVVGFSSGAQMTGTISNSGTLVSNNNAIFMGDGASLVGNIMNTSTGVMSGNVDAAGLDGHAIRIEQTSSPSLTAPTSGGFANRPVLSGSIVNSGSIRATGANTSAIELLVGEITGSISNGIGGSITSADDVAINISSSLLGGGIQNSSASSVIRGSSAIVIGQEDTVITHASVVSGGISNSGIIEGVTGAAIDIATGGQLQGGVSNILGGTIDGSSAAINISGGGSVTGGITNAGLIVGSNALSTGINVLGAGSSVTGGVNNSAGGTIRGAVGAITVDTGSLDSINNAGTLSQTGTVSGAAIDITGGTLTGTFTNSGVVDAQGVGVFVHNGAIISGAISNSGSIGGGVLIEDATLTGGLSNTGAIDSALNGDAVVIRGSGSTISGIQNSGTISGVSGIVADNLAVIPIINNAAGGVITGTGGVAISTTNGGSITAITNAGTVNGTIDFGMAGGSFTITGGVVGDVLNATNVTISGGSVGNIPLAMGTTLTITGGSVGAVSNYQGDLTNAGTLGSVTFAAPGAMVTNTGTIGGNLNDVGAVTNSGNLGNVTLLAMGGTFNNTGVAGDVSNVTGTSSNDGSVGAVTFVAGGGIFNNTGDVAGLVGATEINNSGTIGGNITGADFVFNDGGTLGNVTFMNGGVYGSVGGTSGSLMNASGIDILTGSNPGVVVSTINGNLSFNGVLKVQASGSTTGINNYGLLNVTGNADVTGASVFVLATNIQSLRRGDSFNFLTAGTLTSDITNFAACDAVTDVDCETPVTGITVQDSSQPIQFNVIQNGNTLTARIGDIDFTPIIPPDGGGSGGSNVTNLAGALNTIVGRGDDLTGTSLGAVTTSLAQIDVTTPQGQQAYTDALSTLDPDTIDGAASGALTADIVAASTIVSRLTALRGYYGFSGAIAGDPLSVNGFWLQAYDNETDQDVRDGVDGFDADTYGLALGIDAPWGENMIIGMALSYADTEVEMKQASNNGLDISSIRLSAYGSYNADNYYVDAQIAYSANNYESVRVIDPVISGGTPLVATGDHDGDQFSLRVRNGYPMVFDNGFFVTPMLEMNYNHLSEDDYREKNAGNAGLNMSTDDLEVLVLGLGVKIAYPWTTESEVTWIPEFSVDYMYDTIGDEVEVVSDFVGVTGAAFITEGANAEQEAVKVGLKVRAFSQGNFSFAGGYDYITKQDYESHSISATVRYDF